jgi:hypothetical protein
MSTVPISAKPRIKSYRDDASAGLQCKEFPGHMDSDDFTTVTHKKKSTQTTPLATTVKQCCHPLIGVKNCVLLPAVSKKERSKALFVLHFSPEVTTVDVEAEGESEL